MTARQGKGGCTSPMFFDSIVTHLHDPIVRLVTGKAVVDFEENMA